MIKDIKFTNPLNDLIRLINYLRNKNKDHPRLKWFKRELKR